MLKSILGSLLLLIFISNGMTELTLGTESATTVLACTFIPPGDTQPLTLSFDKSPLIISTPGQEIRLQLLQEGKSLPLTEVFHGRKGENPTRTKLDHDQAIRLQSPGAGMIHVVSLRSQATTFTLVCATPIYPWGPLERFGTLKIEGTQLGRYQNPLTSNVEKVRRHPQSYLPPQAFVNRQSLESTLLISNKLSLSDTVIANEENIIHSNWIPVLYHAWLAFDQFIMIMESSGIPESSIRLLSTFRTPDYNLSIGSGAYGRHLYGDAFDFYIDQNRDGRADDLTGDNKVDLDDAKVIIRILTAAQTKGLLPAGGIGCYYFPHEFKRYRLTFHIDFRGHDATWAFQYNRQGRSSEIDWDSLAGTR